MRRRGWVQWAGLGAILYVVLFIPGAILTFGAGQPDSDAAPGVVFRYYHDSGHRDRVGVGWILIVLGLFFFLWFLAALRHVLSRLDVEGFLTTLALVGGAVYAALAFASVSVNMAIKTMSDDTFHDLVYPPLIHAADDTAYVLHSTGGIAAGTMMIAASLVALRSRAVPNWLAWIGVVAGIIALFSLLFFPQILIALWLLAAGALVFLSAQPQGAHIGPR